MEKQVEVKKQNAVVLNDLQNEMMGAMNYSNVDSSDVQIPKLLMMQAMSKLVVEKELASAGDLVNSITGEIYAGKGVTLKVVPVEMYKTWTISEVVGGKLEYRKTVPFTIQNSDMQWNTTDEEGREYKNVQNINFYVLLEKDLGDRLALPHVISFRSTSLKEGKNIAGYFHECLMAKNEGIFKVHFDTFFEISGERTTNDDGTWYKMAAKKGEATSADVQKQAFTWYKTLKVSDHSDVDNSELNDNKKTAPVSTAKAEF